MILFFYLHDDGNSQLVINRSVFVFVKKNDKFSMFFFVSNSKAIVC